MSAYSSCEFRTDGSSSGQADDSVPLIKNKIIAEVMALRSHASSLFMREIRLDSQPKSLGNDFAFYSHLRFALSNLLNVVALSQKDHHPGSYQMDLSD